MSIEKSRKKIEEKKINTAKSRLYPKIKIIHAALFLVLFLFFSFILCLAFGESPRGSAGRTATLENAAALLGQLENPDSASFEAVMNYNWVFETGNAVSSNAYVENSPQNQNAFYFTVTLSGTDQTILYVSPDLAAGEFLDNIRLDTALPAGNYDAALTYYLLDEKKNVTDTVEMAVSITVEK